VNNPGAKAWPHRGPAGARELQAGQDPAAGASPDEAFGISLIATVRKPATRAR